MRPFLKTLLQRSLKISLLLFADLLKEAFPKPCLYRVIKVSKTYFSHWLFHPQKAIFISGLTLLDWVQAW